MDNREDIIDIRQNLISFLALFTISLIRYIYPRSKDRRIDGRRAVVLTYGLAEGKGRREEDFQ